MAGVFARTNEVNNHPKRNTFPLSFQNNLSGKFGILYPCLVQDVIPGFTFKDKPTFALEFMPTAFPVQTRVRAHMHFFYVRNRNLWKDFADFYGRTKENLVPPYVDINSDTKLKAMASTGSLGDYLNIPTTLVGRYGTYSARYESYLNGANWIFPKSHIQANTISEYVTGWGSATLRLSSLESFNTSLGEIKTSFTSGVSFNGIVSFEHGNIPETHDLTLTFVTPKQVAPRGEIPGKTVYNNLVSSSNGRFGSPALILTYDMDGSDDFGYCVYPLLDAGKNLASSVAGEYLARISSAPKVSEGSDGSYSVTFTLTFKKTLKELYSVDARFGIFLGYAFNRDMVYHQFVDSSTGVFYYPFSDVSHAAATSVGSQVPWFPLVNPTSVASGVSSSSADGLVHDLDLNTSPYYNSSNSAGVASRQIKLSAFPFRAYESIYNAFYRDQRNNPFIINGQPEYNKWIPSTDGGLDSNTYQLRYRNWEQDFLTTAVQSPQQGVAPLVGIVQLHSGSSLAFSDPETNETFTAQVDLNEDGTVKEFKANTSDMPVSQFRSLIDLATSGISINDFRNVNALQRWLETNMRKGYRLKDIIKGHYDVNVRFDELDMPEFIGGVSQDVMPTMVTQTAEGGAGSPLGSYAGQLSCVGTSKHSIRHYCDEPGFIIGILSVVPVPNYSQLLPKYWLRHNALDYFFPEFGHLGYQPITYREVCPVQAFNAGTDLSTVFGYQRSWYDYISRVDEVHGQMRTTLRDFLINRVFDKAPQLSEDFLLVDPSQTNQIFTVTAQNEDVWMGQVYHDFQAKEPIPLYGIPKLE